MNQTREGDLLWTPSEERKSQANITRYMAWLRDTRGLHLRVVRGPVALVR